MNEIKVLKKEIKALKTELELSENELKVEVENNKELTETNLLYGDMLSKARDWVHFEFKDALDDNILSQVRLERCKIKKILNINYEAKNGKKCMNS